MNGLLQTSFFFGYNAVVCYAFFLMLGSVGFTASLTFVRHIYRCAAAALSDAGACCCAQYSYSTSCSCMAKWPDMDMPAVSG